jgi:hypothetical protein
MTESRYADSPGLAVSKGGVLMIRKLTTIVLLTLGVGCTSSEGTSSDGLQIEPCHGQTSDPFNLGYPSLSGLQDHIVLIAPVEVASRSVHPSFAVCWDGAIIDTAPGGVDLRLFYDAHGDVSDAPETQDIRIDVAPLLDRLGLPLSFWIHNANDNDFTKKVTVRD